MYSLRSVCLTTAATMAALMTVCAAPPSFAGTSETPTAPNYMPVGGPVGAPTGYLELCTRSPIDCRQSPKDALDLIAAGARTALIEKRQSQIRTAKVDGRGAPVQTPAETQQAAPVVAPLANSVHPTAYVRVNLDEPTMEMVIALNDRVNHAIKAETDQEIYHVADYWTAPGVGQGARGDCEDFALEKRRLLIDSGIPAEALSIAIVRTPAGEVHAVLVISAKQGDYILDNLHGEVKAWQMTGYSWISRQAPGNDLGWVSLVPANPVHVETASLR